MYHEDLKFLIAIFFIFSKLRQYIPKKLKEFIFQRVFIDEADNIKITGGRMPLALFHWFITSSVENLLFPGGSYYIQKDDNEVLGYQNTKLENITGLKFKNYITHFRTNLKFMIFY